jgi:hypothetical protein
MLSSIAGRSLRVEYGRSQIVGSAGALAAGAGRAGAAAVCFGASAFGAVAPAFGGTAFGFCAAVASVFAGAIVEDWLAGEPAAPAGLAGVGLVGADAVVAAPGSATAFGRFGSVFGAAAGAGLVAPGFALAAGVARSILGGLRAGAGAGIAVIGADGVAAIGGAARSFDRVSHQPAAAATTISAASTGKRLRLRRVETTGLPSVGASPSRRCCSDFFKASRISDMGFLEPAPSSGAVDHSSSIAGAHAPYRTVRASRGPLSSSAESANSVSGPTMPSALMP